jgi:hypothetical protein
MAESENPQVLPSTDSAVGALDDLPAHLVRAFEITGHFVPLPPPRPGDWLAEHPEPGQTFEQFLRVGPQQPDARRQKLYLLPWGNSHRIEAPPSIYCGSLRLPSFRWRSPYCRRSTWIQRPSKDAGTPIPGSSSSMPVRFFGF